MVPTQSPSIFRLSDSQSAILSTRKDFRSGLLTSTRPRGLRGGDSGYCKRHLTTDRRRRDPVHSVPRDDLAFAAVHVEFAERVAGAAAHQEFRTAAADRVVTAAARRGFAYLVFRQLRQA